MRRAHHSLALCLLLALALPAGEPAPQPVAPPPETPAQPGPPALKPELLLVTRAGGPGDQWLRQVRVTGNTVVALGESDFTVSVTVTGNTVKGSVNGNASAQHKGVTRGISHTKATKLGPLTYGYKQVAPMLQQPYLTGPGFTLWNWTEEQAKKAKGTYAPFMADSGISYVEFSPHGTFFAASYCDGGNTSLRVHPRNIDKDLPFAIGHGGGGGKSAFCFEFDMKGELLRQMVFRGWVNDVCWDDFGRPLVAGAGVLKAGQAPHTFGSSDGAGLAMADADWTRLVFGTHIGAGGGEGGEGKSGDKQEAVFWSVAIDSSSGLCAACGYVSGPLAGVNALQPAPGGGTDGLLAIFRLWTPEAYKASKTPAKKKPLPF